MHPLYTAATEVVDRLRAARLEVVHLSADLAQAEYDLKLAQARIERGLIKRVDGEKALAPTAKDTAKDRDRIFTLALDADPDYGKQLGRCNALKMRVDEARAEVASLRDKLNVMLAAMNVAADDS